MFGQPLSKRPKYPFVNTHRWVDYLELLALTDSDGLVAVSDLKDLINTELTDADDVIDLDNDPKVDGPDRFEQRHHEYFNHLKARSNFYGDTYPFLLTEDGLIRKASLEPVHAAYIYLLCCSSLGYIESTAKSKLTSDFELISTAYLKTVKNMSNGPYVFGKNASESISRYTGNLYAKIKTLAEDLGASFNLPESDFSPTDTGDGGVDIVGWDNPWDKTTSQFVYLGNCKCSETWQEVSSPASIVKGWFTLNNGAVNLFFIPFNFRNVGNGWHKSTVVNGKVLFDRFRLLKSFPLSTFISSESYRLISEQFPIRNEQS
jgi:hypothetical protein